MKKKIKLNELKFSQSYNKLYICKHKKHNKRYSKKIK